MDGSAIFAVVIVIGVLVMMAHGARLKLLQRDYMFGNLGKRFQGRRYRSNPFLGPRFVFSYGRPRVVVSWHRANGGCVQTRIDWPEPNWRFQLSAQRTPADSPNSVAGIEPVVEMNHYAAQAGALSSDVLAAYFKLAELSDPLPDVRVSHGAMVIRCYADLRMTLQLEQIVLACLEIYDQAYLMTERGVEWGRFEVASDAVCRICGESIEHDLVNCRRCRTPHHRDCWVYNGSCSTYGCQETVFLDDGEPEQSRYA